MGYCFFCFLRPLHDSVATENDCSGNDGAGKLFWCIKNRSSKSEISRFFTYIEVLNLLRGSVSVYKTYKP